MKNFIKLFFIFLSFLFSLSFLNYNSEGISTELNQLTAVNIINIAETPNQELNFKPIKSEQTIVSSNTNNYELFSFNERKELSFSGILDKATIQNKKFQQILTNNYQQLYTRISHKISPHLKNEICTRAP